MEGFHAVFCVCVCGCVCVPLHLCPFWPPRCFKRGQTSSLSRPGVSSLSLSLSERGLAAFEGKPPGLVKGVARSCGAMSSSGLSEVLVTCQINTSPAQIAAPHTNMCTLNCNSLVVMGIGSFAEVRQALTRVCLCVCVCVTERTGLMAGR